jgi:hypothetical protein
MRDRNWNVGFSTSKLIGKMIFSDFSCALTYRSQGRYSPRDALEVENKLKFRLGAENWL